MQLQFTQHTISRYSKPSGGVAQTGSTFCESIFDALHIKIRTTHPGFFNRLFSECKNQILGILRESVMPTNSTNWNLGKNSPTNVALHTWKFQPTSKGSSRPSIHLPKMPHWSSVETSWAFILSIFRLFLPYCAGKFPWRPWGKWRDSLAPGNSGWPTHSYTWANINPVKVKRTKNITVTWGDFNRKLLGSWEICPKEKNFYWCLSFLWWHIKGYAKHHEKYI